MPEFPADGRLVPFSDRATKEDILACFRLLLGRNPNPEEWPGHAMRAGEDLRGVVSSFTGSLEYARRNLAVAGDEPGIVLSRFEDVLIYSATDDASIGSAVRSGSYEPEVCATLRRLLRPGMHVLDIGANIGALALLAASIVGQAGSVLAVEPNPRNARLLEASRRENGFSHILVLQVAAGADHGLLVLNTSYSNGTTSALPEQASAVLATQTVPVIRLDALLDPSQRLHLIKVDVEGAEYLALRGCEAAIRRDMPIIISEFSPGLMPGISGVSGPDYLGWLVELGYDLAVVRPDGAIDEAASDIEAVMNLYQARGRDHIDVLAQPGKFRS